MLRRKESFFVLFFVLFCLFTNITFLNDANADPLVISGSNQMSINGSQTLAVSGGSGEYAWSQAAGGGNLQGTSSNSTNFIAPASNSNCVSNATICVTDSSAQRACIQIAINQVLDNSIAFGYKASNFCNGPIHNGPYLCWQCGVVINNYRCDGSHGNCINFSATHNCCAGVGYSCDSCDSCRSYFVSDAYMDLGVPTSSPFYPGKLPLDQFQDLRTAAQIANGCCPAGLTAGDDSNDPNKANNKGKNCEGSATVGSSANLKSGNLFHSQDVGILTLSYNSIDTYNGPLGKKWTHNYNERLTAVSDNSAIILQSADGNIIYYRPSGGAYYPENISGDTSIIIKYSNGTYTRTLKTGTVYNFNSSGNLTTIADRNNNTTTLTYSGADLTSITDPAGRITTITTNGGRITSITDPGGRTYSLVYTNGVLSSVIDPLGNAWFYTYDTDGKMLTKTDPAGNTITYTYDTNNKLLTSTAPDGTRQMNYNQTGTTTFTEKDGDLWTYTYDPIFAVKTAMTDPLGNTTRYAYDAKRNLIATTAPDGSITSSTYDSNSNVTSLTDPLGNIVSYTYNSMNLVTSFTDSRGSITSYTYDARGNLIRVTDPTGAITNYQYDARGNVTAIIDANNQNTSLAYDAQNNLISITDPLGKQTAFTYDAVGNPLTMTDPLGNITSYVYNDLNQMTQVTDPKGNITRFTYDFMGNLLTAVDAIGKPTNYAYNYRGQVTQITDALNNLNKMTYGPTGCGGACGGANKLTALTDALNHSTQYTYDLAGRLVKETDPLGNVIINTYDAKGNLITKTKADGKTITYAYDAGNRLTGKQYSDGSLTQFQYDANGNITYAGNQSIAYSFTYDADNRMTGITDSNARTVQYQYNFLGDLTSMVTPEGRTIGYVYDAARRLISITTDGRIFGLGYDDGGRRTSFYYPNNTAAIYAYDYNGNLTRLLHTSTGLTTLADINYTYDNVNNRLSRADVTISAYDPSGTEVMSYDAANELLNFNSTTYSYDPNGNRIQNAESSGVTTYNYDDEDRLTRVEIIGATPSIITYTYDPFGRRIEKNVNGMITRYLYDRDAIILEYDQTGTVQTRYTHGPGIDEPLAVEKNGRMYYYHADGLGSIVLLTSANGSVTQRYDYDAFGNITSGTPIVTQPYTYTAREYDPETGLYFYRARYYDPKAGRFVTKDPIGFTGGDVNLYNYVQNNPVNWIDPKGLDVTIDINRTTYTPNSIIGTINITSTATKSTFSGNTLENRTPPNSSLPVPAGTYSAFMRRDRTPNRVELIGVPNASNIQIHTGNRPADVKGCFAAGTSASTDRVKDSRNAMNRINEIISADGSGKITIIISGSPTGP